MLKFLKKKWLWIIVILVVAGVVVFLTLSPKNQTNYVTEKAVIGNLNQTVEVTGSVEAADDIDLNFISSGTLQDVLVSAGDEVKSGDILARLFAGDISSQVADARANLDIAKLELEQLLSGASSEDIKVTEEELVSAQQSYDSAYDDLKSLEGTRDNEMESLREIALNTLKDKHSVVLYSLETVYDAILDEDAVDDLYVSDVVNLTQAKNDYNDAKNFYDEDEILIASAIASQSEEDILSALESLGHTLDITLSAVNESFDAMVDTLYNGHYTTTNVGTYKTNLSTKGASLSTAISAVQDASSDIKTRRLYYQTQIIDARNSMASAQASLNLAQAKLDLKKAPPRDFEIESAKATIRRAEATLNRYLSDWSETVIKAPVDGVITEVNFDVGEQTSLSKPVISMIGKSNMQIEVDVPESDIVKLSVGDQVNVALDAFSSDEKFIGTVTFIDPASTVIDGVVYYQVKVSFNEEDPRVRTGMTADLTIDTDNRENVLIVPSRAVIYREDKKYVQLYDGQRLSEVEVVTGLKGDGGLIEITSGLSEGDSVVTFIKNGK